MSINEKVKKYSIFIFTIVSVAAYITLQTSTVNYIVSNSIIKSFTDLKNTSNLIFAFIFEGIRAATGVLLLYFVGRQPLKKFGVQFRKKDISIVLIGFALLILMHFMFTYLTSKMNLALWDYKFAKYIVHRYFLYAILIRFLLVGIGEEFFFRGFLFKALEPYGRIVQYVVNILFFVSVHFLNNKFNFLYLLELVSATYLLCYVYEKTRSIWPGVILHGAIDLLATLFSWNFVGISVVNLWWKSEYNAGDAFNWLYIICNILLIALVWYFNRLQFKKNIDKSSVIE